MPFDRNDGLVDRDDIFSNLDRLLSSSSRNRSAAIWGLGGCGKTQVALEYAYRFQAKTLCAIFWIHADSEASFTQDYSDLARIAGVSLDLKGEDLLGAVKQWIENQRNWLLVLDNADNLAIFKKPYSASKDHQLLGPELLRFVPKSQTGTIIWTSRDGGICGNIVDVHRGIEVTAMTIEQARDLFRKLTGRSELMLSEDEDMLLELLQYLPLAIAQAAAYIRKTKVSIKQYLTFLHESESRQLDLLSQEFQDVYRSGVPNSVMRTWLISMKQISKESSCSEKILNTITFFDHKGIPFELIKAAAGPTYSEDEILLAASRLTEYSFLQTQRAVDEGLPTYEQHRLVHLATRQTLSEAQVYSFSGEALRIMANFASMWQNAEEYKDQAPVLLRHMGYYYWEQGYSEKAEQLEIEVLELRKEILGIKHPDTITAMASLASTWWQQGHSEKAEQLEIEVLELRKKILGTRHPDTITAMANLASTWWQQGYSEKAEELEIEVLELRKEILGAKHPDTITAMENLKDINQQYISDIEELRLNNTSSISLQNLDFTQQEILPKKFHSWLKDWTRKVTRFGRPKN
ncbi:kinesin light chain protein [Rutstroemia sp. NJR-2017a WRK4]|nr:kinesin light chain protein [Rutstroemia sp. NJR-2017a WRK4]